MQKASKLKKLTPELKEFLMDYSEFQRKWPITRIYDAVGIRRQTMNKHIDNRKAERS